MNTRFAKLTLATLISASLGLSPLGVMAAAADEFIKTFGATNVCVYMPEAGR